MMKQIEGGAWKIVGGTLIFSFALSLLQSISHHAPAPTTVAQPAPATSAVARPRAASTITSGQPAPKSTDTIAPSKLVVTWPALTPPAGWHKLTLSAVHVPSVGPVSADVFRRGPNDSAPPTIQPFSAPAAALALPPMSAATTSAPRAIPGGGR